MLAPGQSAVIDVEGVVEVLLANPNHWLQSCDDAALVGGANLAVIGDEMLQFGSAEPIAPGRDSVDVPPGPDLSGYRIEVAGSATTALFSVTETQLVIGATELASLGAGPLTITRAKRGRSACRGRQRSTSTHRILPMSQTSRLGLPFIEPGQTQKELFHNEALRLVDVAVAAAVESVGANAPPGSAVDGQCFIVGSAPTGAWAGHAGAIAGYAAGGWRFVAAVAGMRALYKVSGQTASYEGTAWAVGTIKGAKLELAGSQVVGAQLAAVANPTGGTTVDAEARAAIVAILDRLRGHGLIAPKPGCRVGAGSLERGDEDSLGDRVGVDAGCGERARAMGRRRAHAHFLRLGQGRA